MHHHLGQFRWKSSSIRMDQLKQRRWLLRTGTRDVPVFTAASLLAIDSVWVCLTSAGSSSGERFALLTDCAEISDRVGVGSGTLAGLWSNDCPIDCRWLLRDREDCRVLLTRSDREIYRVRVLVWLDGSVPCKIFIRSMYSQWALNS